MVDCPSPRMAGSTVPRMIKQIKRHSLQLPTLHFRTRKSPIYGGRATGGGHDLLVREEPSIDDITSQNQATAELILNNTTQVTMNFERAPTFDPAEHHVTAFSKLRSLDSLPAVGLAEEEFWSVFSKCRGCSNFMTSRTIPYHICPSSTTANKEVDPKLVKTVNFPRLLDAHDTDFSAGVSEETFSAIFYICPSCGRYMTQRVSFNHHDDEDFDSPPFPCIYIGKLHEPATNGKIRLLEDYPPLSPLHPTVANN